ncbi:Copper transporter 6 [Acorus gramineus]|uniref:Copper transport protein n=1 Tax=Acorus gramineus TaxID=55184 RepID=A0AAV9B6G7_ACOGR|nr:Copper transporter 6 [Acorus gramineus]
MDMEGHDHNGSSSSMAGQGRAMTHMIFYWGSYGYILFDGWPGERVGMYVLALIVVFVASALVEWLASTQLVRTEWNGVGARLARTVLYAVRVGLAYLVMLAVMSFNVGVVIVAVAGHAVGFLVFRSRVCGGSGMVNGVKAVGGDDGPCGPC